MNPLSRIGFSRSKASNSKYLRPSRPLSKRLSVECLEDRCLLSVGTSAMLTVVPETYPTDALHFHTLQDALASAAGANDTIQIEPGASAGAFNNTTLAAAAAAGATTIVTADPVSPAEVVLVGTQRDVIDAVGPAAGGHFTLTLHNALTNAEPVGTVVSNTSTIGIDGTVTIVGDPNAPPASIAFPLEVWSGTIQVTLQNLSIPKLILDPDTAQTQLLDSTVSAEAGGGEVMEVGGGLGNGQNVFEGDTFSGIFFTLTGNNPGTPTNDKILNNRFTDGSQILLQEDDGTLVQGNSIAGQLANGVTLSVDDSQHVTVSQNRFTLLPGGDVVGAAMLRVEFVEHPTSATIMNNVVSTNGLGVGLILNVGSAANFEALVQGNDFRANSIGVEIFGDSVSAGAVDLGGGSAGNLGTSSGGNNFRGFEASGTANGVFAVSLLDTQAAASVSAQDNIWSVADPTTIIRDGTHNTNTGGGLLPGTGSIQVGSTQLSANQQFVQTLFNDFLGRSGSLTELNSWVAQLPTLGQAVVANDIIHSQEALTNLVDSYYLKYLSRPADTAGQAAWVSVLEHGGTAEQVAIGLLSSPEYYNRATALSNSPDPDANFVESLYEQLLGRPGGATEIEGWLTQLPALGRNGVVADIIGSAEYRTDEVLGLYVTLLHRQAQPSAAELAFWANSNVDLLSIEVQFTGTQEFFVNG
jgi:hypothetical protein